MPDFWDRLMMVVFWIAASCLMISAIGKFVVAITSI